MDTIRITDKSYDRIIKWRQENEHKIKQLEFRVPFKNGRFYFEDTKMDMRFEVQGENITIHLMTSEPLKLTTKLKAKINWKGIDRKTILLNTEGKFFSPKDLRHLQYVHGVCHLFESVCLYTISPDKNILEDKLKSMMDFFKKLEEPKETKIAKSNKKNIKQYTNKFIKLRSRKKYDKKDDDNKRNYTRYTDTWSVRGFYRTYKNGKRIWIEGYKKGKGKAKNKDYII